MELITVKCKGDLGTHLELGEITEGRILQIRPDQMSEELFEVVQDLPAPKTKNKKEN